METFPVELSERILKKAERLGVLPQDIDEKFVRGSGAGGQKINKTNNCVWLRHEPSSTEVKCQRHRERERNRASAYKLLILKIEEEKLGKQSDMAQKVFKLRKQKKRRSRRAKEKMMDEKSHRASFKKTRKPLRNDEL